jgi:putative transposase
MRDYFTLVAHFVVTLVRMLGPGGARSVVAESLLVKHQLLIVNRSRQRAPNLRIGDRILMSVIALLMRPARLAKSAIIVRPATILRFHQALKDRKYRLLFSPKCRAKPGPKGPSDELIAAIVDTKHRNPRWGCPRIAQQLSLAFDIEIDKDVVRRVLARHYRPDPRNRGPSWLSFIGHTKDSLWSVDLFRCESATLNSYWVLVVMDQFTRRIIGFGIQRGDVDGQALCRMFNKAISTKPRPKYLSSDNDPLFGYHQWRANLRILEIDEIKTVPYVPLSHPFVERLIGTIRREFLDQVLFWSSNDLERKLSEFTDYYNHHRVHSALPRDAPARSAGASDNLKANLAEYCWKPHCRGLFQTPVPA